MYRKQTRVRKRPFVKRMVASTMQARLEISVARPGDQRRMANFVFTTFAAYEATGRVQSTIEEVFARE